MSLRRLLVAVSAVAVAAVVAVPVAATAQAKPKLIEHLQPYGPATRPFSPAVRVGNLLFLAGQVGTDPSAGGKLVAGGIKAETRQVMNNIKDVLLKVGSNMDQVAKCTVFLADMKEWGQMNEVYAEFFAKDKMPARSAFGTSGLALDARVEIECIAAVQ